MSEIIKSFDELTAEECGICTNVQQCEECDKQDADCLVIDADNRYLCEDCIREMYEDPIILSLTNGDKEIELERFDIFYTQDGFLDGVNVRALTLNIKYSSCDLAEMRYRYNAVSVEDEDSSGRKLIDIFN